MSQDRSLDVLDFLVLLVKWKKFLIILFFLTFLTSYAIVYFFIDEEFESSGLVIPSGESSIAGISSLMKNLKDLPLGLGGKSKTGDTDLYLTIVYSRTTLDKLIYKFDLLQDYGMESYEKARKKLQKQIEANVTDENAFELIIRANSPQKAVKMVDFLLNYLNQKVIELNIAKSKYNREFLEQRYFEIKDNLRIAEDSMQTFQEKSGMFEAEEQMKLIMSAYSKLETDFLSKQVEYSIMAKLLPQDSPQLTNIKTQINEFEKSLQNIKKSGRPESVFLSFNSLPNKAKMYLRHYRNIAVYNAILEFLVPLYEQAKFEEQKNIPVLQIIDHGSLPEKKSFPPRTIIALITSFVVFFIGLFFLTLKEIISNSTNIKMRFVIQNLSFSRKSKI